MKKIIVTKAKARVSLIISGFFYFIISIAFYFMYIGKGFNSVFGAGLSEYYHYPFIATLSQFIGIFAPVFLFGLFLFLFSEKKYNLVYKFGYVVFFIFLFSMAFLNMHMQQQIEQAIKTGNKNMALGMYHKNSLFLIGAQDFLCPGSQKYFLRLANSPDVQDTAGNVEIKLIRTYIDPTDGIKKNLGQLLGG